MSQFAGLVEQYKAGKPGEKKPRSQKSKEEKMASSSPAIVDEPKLDKAQPERKGKSKNPDYTQVLTYLKKETHNRVKAALIFDEKKRDLSDLVQELLEGWAKKNIQN